MVRKNLIKILYKVSPLLGDVIYLKILFYLRLGYKLNLKNPKTFNEKLQWLKIHYKDPKLPNYVDKYEFKKIVCEKFGSQYVVQNYGVWNTFDEIDFKSLPNKFVLKTTHDQGGVVICHDKDKLDLDKCRLKINKHLNSNLYYKFREWPYKNLKPRIIAEEYIENSQGDLVDYKLYCFDGEPKIVFIAYGRNNSDKVYFDFYDMDFKQLNIKRANTNTSKVKHNKPENFNKMVEFARVLSKGIPHVRVDFYNVNGQIYFGEFTLFTGGGFKPFYPESWDYILGEYINLKYFNENTCSC